VSRAVPDGGRPSRGTPDPAPPGTAGHDATAATDDHPAVQGEYPADWLSLGNVQRWLLTQITGQTDVASGVPEVSAGDLLAPSRALSAEGRLAVYQHAYTARLLEVLREDYKVLCRALGDDLFNRFALEYLRQYPSTSYTLGRLGDQFVTFLEQSRPARDEDVSGEPDWSDCIIDLARLEAVVNRVFDGPGEEDLSPLQASHLQGLTPERFADAEVHLAPSLAFVSLRFPLDEHFTALVRGERPDLPEPAPEVVAVWRSNYRVHRLKIDPAAHRLLDLLREGGILGEALARLVHERPELVLQLGALLPVWFQAWTQRGWIVHVEVPGLVSPTSG